MTQGFVFSPRAAQGILIRDSFSDEDASILCEQILAQLDARELAVQVEARYGTDAQSRYLRLQLKSEHCAAWAPGHNTLGLCSTLGLVPHENAEHRLREIVLCMLMAPQTFEFPSVAEFMAAVRIRRNIAEAARKTSLAFHTSQAERPADCWTYAEGKGFVLLPDASLIPALRKTTQPEVSGTRYSFSCYRATEYVCLLGICEELAGSNPELLGRLENLWRTRSIMSGEFHEVFLREQGSVEQPLPPYYFVPGDRLWFRNPDEHSSDASGFEGSWVFYMGEGLFSNFWDSQQPYTLDAKCLEIYHWRHGVRPDEAGDLRMDEEQVARLVDASRQNPTEEAGILARMQRYRDPSGTYAEGGCLDSTREAPRWVCPGTADLNLPPQ